MKKKFLLFFALMYGAVDVQRMYASKESLQAASLRKALENVKDIADKELGTNSLWKKWLEPQTILPVIVIGITIYQLKFVMKMMEQPFQGQVFKPSDITERFYSVAGAEEAKEELEDLVDYLKNSKKYQEIGAKIRKGVLMTGQPGNGKTLLARALAGEAGCPFIVMNGADFSSKFLGGTTAQVTRLFMEAHKLAIEYGACIIFIDEIDVIGRERGAGGHSETEAALNKLLTEMDGFQQQGQPIIVIGATNRKDTLDPALLRPGRMDRVIEVGLPNLNAREGILKIHSKHVKLDANVNLKVVAKASVGFSGAQLANLINEAALTAFKKHQKVVTMHDLEEAIDTLRLGKESKGIKMSDEEKKCTAYHEAGHALVTLMLPDLLSPLHKVTILPRGGALGITYSIPEREKYSIVTQELLAHVKHALGGRIAEEIVFGKVSTGASSDFENASNTVRDMVCRYGMSDQLGTVVYGQRQNDFVYSQGSANKIDDEVRRVMAQCYADTKKLLTQNRDKLDKLAQALLEKETLYAREIYELLEITPREDHKLL